MTGMDLLGLMLGASILAVDLWALWYIGSYENTGVRGWRRIWAGARLLLDLLHLHLQQWIARSHRQGK